MSKVSIIGLGAIGAGAAKALAQGKGGRKYEMTGFDVRAETMQELSGVLTPAASPAAASEGVDVVLIAVMNDAQVKAVLTGEGGILSATKLPRAVAILATITMPTVFWAHEVCAAKGVALMDCGVSGGSHAMAAASTTSMVGGDDAAFAIIGPVIEGFSDPVVHCGALGNGMRAKLCRNLIIYTDWHTAWEGARLAHAAGVPMDKFVECVEASDKWVRPHMQMVKEGVGLPGATQTGATTAVFADKDLAAALALGKELGVELPAATLAAASFHKVAGID